MFAVLYHFSCTDVRFYFLVHCTYSWFSKWQPSAMDFHIFSIFAKNSNLSTSTCKIWWRSDDLRPSYCLFTIFIWCDYL